MVLRPWAIHGASLWFTEFAGGLGAATYWGAGSVAFIALAIMVLRASRTG